jgi:hypothetical protein
MVFLPEKTIGENRSMEDILAQKGSFLPARRGFMLY